MLYQITYTDTEGRIFSYDLFHSKKCAYERLDTPGWEHYPDHPTMASYWSSYHGADRFAHAHPVPREILETATRREHCAGSCVKRLDGTRWA